MPRVLNMAPAMPASPLTSALTQLETTERELVTALEVTTAHLSATREAITALRRMPVVGGGVGSVAGESRQAPRYPRTPALKPEKARLAAAAAGPLQKGVAGAAAAAARARAILILLAVAARTVAELRAALPVPPGASDLQHRQSVANSLTRMKASGLVKGAGDGWALTAKGQHAAAAAKEAP